MEAAGLPSAIETCHHFDSDTHSQITQFAKHLKAFALDGRMATNDGCFSL